MIAIPFRPLLPEAIVYMDGVPVLSLDSFPVRLRVHRGSLLIYLERRQRSQLLLEQITYRRKWGKWEFLLAEKSSRWVDWIEMKRALRLMGLKTHGYTKPPVDGLLTARILRKIYSAFGIDLNMRCGTRIASRVILAPLPKEKNQRGFAILFGHDGEYAKLLDVTIDAMPRGGQHIECDVRNHPIAALLGRQIFAGRDGKEMGFPDIGCGFTMTDYSNDPAHLLPPQQAGGMQSDYEFRPLSTLTTRLASLGFDRNGALKDIIAPD